MRMPLAGTWMLGLLSLLAGAPAEATTYVPMTDEALVDQAPVIAVVQVQGSGGASQNGRPATDYRVRVERVLKGNPAGEITVRVPGGRRPDGMGLHIWGAPRFARGGRALLFLSPRNDGSYSLFHLMLGAFHEVPAGGRRLAVRNLSETHPVLRQGETAREPVRDFDRFTRWVAARAAGLEARESPYVQEPGPLLRSVTDEFTLFEVDGLNLRWFEFETGGTIEWRAYSGGQPGLAGGGFAEFQRALAAWNADPGTNIRYVYGGTTDQTAGFDYEDGVNTILFEGDSAPTFSCGSGGILALGGPWYGGQETSGGQTYYRITAADILTSQGVGCYFLQSPQPSRAAEELFGHELGHTLGLNHSCGDTGSCLDQPLLSDAIMRSSIHNDGRGARLNQDDLAAIARLYPAPGTGFFTLAPCRLLDTRDPQGPYGGPQLSSGQARTVAAAGQCGIPETAVALSANVTLIAPSAPGHLAIYPAGAVPLESSAVSFTGLATRANNAVIPLSDQSFALWPTLESAGSVDVIVDVNGYFE